MRGSVKRPEKRVGRTVELTTGGHPGGLGLTRQQARVMLRPSMATEGARAQLIHIETDRRLGHEWDEWDGKPLPGNGDFSAPPGLFFRFAALALVVAQGGVASLLFLLAPRLQTVAPALPA